MENKYILGVVVGKIQLDYCLLFQDNVLQQGEVMNETTAIRQAFSLLLDKFHISADQLVICAEHAGQFNYPLIYTCESELYKLWLENPGRIKFYCSGLQPAKKYKLNCKQIAVYASRNVDKLVICQQPDSEVEHLKQAYHEWSMLEADSTKLQSQLFDMKNYMSQEVYNVNAKRLVDLIKGLEAAIATVENEIKCIFATNSHLSRQMELLTSIKPIGRDLALKMIVETDAFTRFENSRQFCSHAGMTPMHKDQTAVQHLQQNGNVTRDKSIRVLLSQVVASILKKEDSELKSYFIRKVSEGKDEKVVINAIRVKLVARMFAVIKNNEIYQPVFQEELQDHRP
jgi:transposase